MHLHLVSIQSQVQIGTGNACEESEVPEGLRDRCIAESSEWGGDERAARVARLRAQVRAGTYQIDSQAIAESLLKKQVNFI